MNEVNEENEGAVLIKMICGILRKYEEELEKMNKNLWHLAEAVKSMNNKIDVLTKDKND